MRVLVIVKPDEQYEAGAMPEEKMLADMTEFNEKLVQAGVMLAAEGLHPSAKGARVRFAGGKTTVTRGPFPQPRSLVGGFWMWKVKSLDEAIEWVKKAPFPPGEETEIEIRPIFEAEDFGKEFTPELRAREEAMREKMAAYQ